jgi:integrase
VSTKLPRGVKALGGGRFQVRVAKTHGSKATVTRVVVDETVALAAYYAGVAARGRGEDVAAAMDGSKASSAPLNRPMTTSSEAVPCRTFAELVERYLAERAILVANSDPTRRSNRSKGVYSLRPTSHKTESRRILTRLVPVFGAMELRTISAEVVQQWLVDIAGEDGGGIDIVTANGYLVTLRALLKRARRSELPDDFPWAGVHPVPPKRPRKQPSDPSVWGGNPGDADPVLPFADGVALATFMHPADRLVLYCEHFGGPRIGETYGLTLGDLYFEGGRLWAHIHQQISPEGDHLPWVKTDAGYRRIPLPGILADYIVQYCKRYHDYDLHDPDVERGTRRLIVNPAGRDHDGTYLPGLRNAMSSRLTKTRDATGFGVDARGYAITSHLLRKSVSTYLLNAEEILLAIEREEASEEPGDDDPVALVAWLRSRVTNLEQITLGFTQRYISSYLGHEYDRRTDEQPASAITLSAYNLTVNSTAPFEAIADLIDRIARFEVGDLLDEPHEWDLLPVHFPSDPSYVTTTVASELIGINRSNVSVAVNDGRLDGHMAWIADGGHTRNRRGSNKKVPALPQLVVSRKSIDDYVEWSSRPSLAECARRLHMSEKALNRNFVDTGRLRPEVVGAKGKVLRVDPVHIDGLISEIHNAIITTLATSGPCTPKRLHALFNEHHGSLFVERRALRTWLDAWVSALVANGTVIRRMNGTLSVPKPKPQ